jgi:aryl-alcohol dehydrogenase-like predicted oxidoreductase
MGTVYEQATLTIAASKARTAYDDCSFLTNSLINNPCCVAGSEEQGLRVSGPESDAPRTHNYLPKETGRRGEIFLVTKFGIRIADGKGKVSGKPDYVKEACKASLERLQIDHIDLYCQHRVDSETPIEKTVEAMAQLKKEGKIRYLGLSECSARTLRRVHKVHPIAAAEMEFSPFALEIESTQNQLLEDGERVGCQIVAYSPLGRGFLSGTIKSRDDFDEMDMRRIHPRFSEENFGDSLKLVEALASVAEEKSCTPGQLALAWVLAQGKC